MKKTIKKDRSFIKNLALMFCLIILALQFLGSFKGLIELIDNNQPYIQVSSYQEPQVFLEGQIVLEEVLKRTEKRGQNNIYVQTDTLEIYTYKLFQTILLLFGIFMCLIFMAINNHNFSLIKSIEEIKQ